MRKKFVLICAIVGSCASLIVPVSANTFSESSHYSLYAGGHDAAKFRHWTRHNLDSRGTKTIGAGIEMNNKPTEVVTGIDYTYVLSQYRADPLYSHTHYRYFY